MNSGSQVTDDPSIAKHLKACSDMFMFYGPNYQQLESLLEQGDMFSSLSMVERRMISVVNLYMRPDLSKVTIPILLII